MFFGLALLNDDDGKALFRMIGPPSFSPALTLLGGSLLDSAPPAIIMDFLLSSFSFLFY